MFLGCGETDHDATQKADKSEGKSATTTGKGKNKDTIKIHANKIFYTNTNQSYVLVLIQIGKCILVGISNRKYKNDCMLYIRPFSTSHHNPI